MRILNLYVDNHLDQPINWVLLEDGQELDSGSCLFDEIIGFENVPVEVYLNAGVCSIFKTNKLSGISTNKLTDELILGLLEEDLVDDIEDIKPIVMRFEDDIAYIAIFSKEFYEQLIFRLVNLDKPIRLVQSFAYCTTIDESLNEWVLYLSDEQNFLRTNTFQYYILDDTKPIPVLLEDMLVRQKPESLIVYANEDYDINELSKKFGIVVKRSEKKLEFGNLVWNFYNQKSSSFKVKVSNSTKNELKRLLTFGKYFVGLLVLLWLINIIVVSTNKHKLENELKDNLSSLGKVDSIDPNTLTRLSDKLRDAVHDRGLRDDQDFVPMFISFLKDIPEVSSDDITEIDFDSVSNTLVVYLRKFNNSQYSSYQDVFKSQHIITELTPYRDYLKSHKTTENVSSRDSLSNDQPISSDTQWVLTLKSVWLFQARQK